MTNNILDYFGNSHATYIHARGKLSTNKLFELLNPQLDEKILEIGFGTGATLVQIASQSNAHFFGYEMSPIMFKKALKRLQFCKISKNITINLLDEKNKFPVPDNSFDRIYAESIFAIQEGSDLRDLFIEIKRVLKPNGVLLFNETIWLESTSKNRAAEINKACKKSFGIIQSNDLYLNVSDWKGLLLELRFDIEITLKVSEINQSKAQKSLATLLSKTYTIIGKTKALFSPTLRRNWKTHQLEMESIINSQEKLMEGYILKAINLKP